MAPDLATSTQPSLLTLPAELRNEIFALAVVSEDERYVKSTSRAFGAPFTFPAPPPLASTCRQIRREIVPVFYCNNTFKISHYQREPFIWWREVRQYFPEAIDHVQSIVLSTWVDDKSSYNAGLYTRTIDVKIAFAYDDRGQVKIDFLAPAEGLCTCIAEKAARIEAQWGKTRDNNLPSIATNVIELYQSWWHDCVQQKMRQNRLENCECGLVNRKKG